MKKFVVFLFLLMLGVAVEAATSVDIDIQRFQLKNGLQVILAPRHETPIIYSLIRYKVGSANEHVGITGISHMLEHMMFKGTRDIQTTNYQAEIPVMKKQDIMFQKVLDLRRKIIQGAPPPGTEKQLEDLLLQIKGLNRTQKLVTIQNEVDVATFRVGFARLGASTTFDRTHYMEFFPSNCLESWAYFESARMRAPVFREFYSERDVVLEERRQATDTQPDATLLERFLATSMMAHPYHWDVIGWQSDIENYTRDDICDYHKTYYAPNNAIVILVGDFQIGEAKSLIHKYFGKIPSQILPKPVAMTIEPKPMGKKRIKVRYKAAPRLILGYHRCQANHPDFVIFEIMDTILCGGRSSVLYKALIQTEMAVNFETGLWEMMRYPGVFSVSAVAGKDTPLDRLEQTILDSIEALKTKPVSQRTLETARSRLTGQLLRRLRNSEELAELLAEGQDFFGSPLAFNDYLERLERVKPADIQRVASKWLTDENLTVAWLIPDHGERKDK